MPTIGYQQSHGEATRWYALSWNRYRVRMMARRAVSHWARQLGRLRRVVRSVFRPSHLLAVAKAAVTATASWVVGISLPGEMAEYAYYAPLGVLVAMAPTVASSLWSSMLAVAGVLIGLAIAWGLIFTGMHGIVALFGAIALSSLVAGVNALGPGRAYIPFAAAFVFLTGGGDPEEFSLGLALQFSLGAAMGVLINLVVPPPLHLHSVRNEVAHVRRSVGLCVAQFGEWIHSAEPGREASELVWLLDEAEDARLHTAGILDHADHNKLGNLRAQFTDTNLVREHDVMNALRQGITELYRVADLPDALTDDGDDDGDGLDDVQHCVIPTSLAGPVASACVAVAASLGVEEPELFQRPAGESALQHVEHAHESVVNCEAMSPAVREWLFVVVFSLRRIAARMSHLESTSASP